MNDNYSFGGASNELEILDKAIFELRKQSNLRVEKISMEMKFGSKMWDSFIRISAQEHESDYFVEIKNNVTKFNLLNLKSQMEKFPGNSILITKYISPDLAKHLKEQDIQFIDTTGNAYINFPSLYLFICGNKAPKIKVKNEKMFFGLAAVKIIFAILCNKNLENANYREIAELTGVSLGSINKIFSELTERGFFIDQGFRRKRLLNKIGLFYIWIEAYSIKLRKKTLIGRYESVDPKIETDLYIAQQNVWIGAEVAASKLISYIKPEIITLYTTNPVNDLILKYKLRKSDKGNIEIREKFWKFTTKYDNANIVHPILIYADLIASGDSRNFETAKIIFKEYIENYLEQN
jgi:hypothetical protein